MTKTIREREPTSLPLHRLYALFRIHFIPERNKQHSRADFFNIKRETGESAADVWKRILEIEKKCEFENITPAELIASKFMSLIGKTSGDYELKRKIKKSNMSIDAITEAIHEYVYEKLNESTDSEEGREIKHIKEKKRYKRPEEQKQSTNKRKRGVNCNKCGSYNWTPTHIPDCPAKNKKCNNCKKVGHFAIVCRSKRINYIHEEMASSAEEDNWTPNRLHLIKKTINSTSATGQKNENYYTKTLMVNKRPIKFIIDTGSPVTLIPLAKFNQRTQITPLTEKYKDVNDNNIKFIGKTNAEVK